MQSIKYIPASSQAANPSLMTVQTIRSAGAADITVNTTTGAPAFFYATMGTPHNFTDPVTGETITVISEASAVDFAGHLNSGKVTIDAIAPGYTDAGSKVGDIIIIRPISAWADNIFNVLNAEHSDDGTHGNITVTSALVKTTNQDLSNENLYTNAIINGGCQVAQRAVPNLSTSYQYGFVDRFAAKATGTAVSAGTINRITSSLLAATKGYDLQIAGATITGTGIVFLRYRIEAKDALNFINAAASFGCRVYHNVGSSVNYTVYIRKANAVDNFTAVTDIANSGAISVPTGVATWLKFENINSGSLGDVSNGIEIEIQIACGAVTTKNFNFAEFVFNKGSKAAAYSPRAYWHELSLCQRYYEKSFPEGQAPANGGSATLFYDGNQFSGANSPYVYTTSTGQVGGWIAFQVRKRTSPTCTGYGNNSGQWTFFPTGGAATWAAANFSLARLCDMGFSLTMNASATSPGMIAGHWTADAEL